MGWTPGSSSTPCFSIPCPNFLNTRRKPKRLLRECVDDPWGPGKACIFRMETECETKRRLSNPDASQFSTSRHSLWQAEEVQDIQPNETSGASFSTMSAAVQKSPSGNLEVTTGRRMSRELMPIEVIQAAAVKTACPRPKKL